MQQPKKTAENLGEVSMMNGQVPAMLMRERDPTGATVVHAVRRSAYVHERLHNMTGPQRLPDELYDAAEKFRQDFERAQLAGNFTRLDLMKTRAGRGEISDSVAAARGRIGKALDGLGQAPDGSASFSQSCVWNIVGLGATLEGWTHLIRANGKAMNTDKAAGVLHSSLERLAFNYGMIDIGKLGALANRQAYSRGVRDTIDHLSIAGATADPTEKKTVDKLMAALRKRFEKFA